MKKGYRYTESGLTNVWLANGYTIRKTKYGEGVSVQDVDGLTRAERYCPDADSGGTWTGVPA